MTTYQPLNLVACDGEDLKVISAMMQDCIITASDMVFDKSMRLFAIMGNRFCWVFDKYPLRDSLWATVFWVFIKILP